MVTGSPEVRLTPYMGAVVLNVDLHSRAGVISLSGTQVWGRLAAMSSGFSSKVVELLPRFFEESFSCFSARNENHSLTLSTSTKPIKVERRWIFGSLIFHTFKIFEAWKCSSHSCPICALEWMNEWGCNYDICKCCMLNKN